ncbi:MAG: hypothetical protein M1817_004257 [Caeruleum heppii]|nr:MAG: hypothetical protein M1817_004257 [Caeruleum heppii]
MVVPLGLDTPRTEIGNATFQSNAGLDFSIEQSFQTPSKDNNDLLKPGRKNGRGVDLRTPRTRGPLAERPNLAFAPPHGEFTPLLKSAAKLNLRRHREQENVDLRSPAFLDPLQRRSRTEAGRADSSVLDAGHTGSFLESQHVDSTPMPQIASSSAMSTPLAVLPKRDGGGMLADGTNMMTLREQENVINKVEKENFGLKLKIHFLEEALSRAGPGYSEAALKENTDLKVDKITLQKELLRHRKNLGAAERDIELYRQQLVELQERARRRHADEGQREEIQRLETALAGKEAEVVDLRQHLERGDGNEEAVASLKDDIGDLEAELREKDRALEDQAESQNAALEKLRDEVGDLEAELREKDRIIENHGEGAENAQEDLKEHMAGLEAELQEKEEALEERSEAHEAEIERLQDAMEGLQNGVIEKEREMDSRTDTYEAHLEKLTEKIHRLEAQSEEKGTTRNNALEMERIRTHDLTEQIHRLEAKLEEKVTTHKNVLAEERTRTRDLTEKLRRLEANLEEKGTTHDHLLELERNRTHDLAEEVHRLKTRLEEKGATHDNLLEAERIRTQDLAEEVLRLEARLGEKETTHQNLVEMERIRIQTLNDEIYSLRKQLSMAEEGQDDACARMRKQIAALEDKLRDEGLDHEEEIARNERSLRNAKGEIEAIQAKLVLAERKADSLEATRDDADRLRAEIEGLRDRITSTQGNAEAVYRLEAENRAMREEQETAKMREEVIETLEAEVDGLKRKLRSTEADGRSLQATVDEKERAERELNSLKKPTGMVETLQVENRDLRQKLTSFRGQGRASERLKEEMSVMQARLEAAEAQCQDVQELRAEIRQMEEDIDRKTRGLRKAEMEKVELEEKVQGLEDEVILLEAQLDEEADRARQEQEELRERLKTTAAHSQSDRELRKRLHRAQDERQAQIKVSQALESDLEKLKRRYERSIKKFNHVQKTFDEQWVAEGERTRKSLDEKSTRLERENRGLRKAIGYMQKRFTREEDFRRHLAFSKKYMTMQLEAHDKCTNFSLDMLEDLGVPIVEPAEPPAPKLRKLRVAANAIIFMHRMQKCRAAWAETLKLKAELKRVRDNARRRHEEAERAARRNRVGEGYVT